MQFLAFQFYPHECVITVFNLLHKNSFHSIKYTMSLFGHQDEKACEAKQGNVRFFFIK